MGCGASTAATGKGGARTRVSTLGKKEQTTMMLEVEKHGEDEFLAGIELQKLRRKKMTGEIQEAGEHEVADSQKVVHHKTAKEKAEIVKMLSNVFLFQKLGEAQLERVVNAVKLETYTRGEVIMTEGEIGERLFFQRTGTSNVYRASASAEEYVRRRSIAEDEKMVETAQMASVDYKTLVTQTKYGNCVGELSLLFKQPRLATVVANENFSAWFLDRTTFRDAVLKSTHSTVTRFLRKMPLFSSLSDNAIVGIANEIDLRKFDPEEIVVESGEESEGLYIILAGTVDAYKGTMESGDFICMLNPSLFFGDRPLTTSAAFDVTYCAGNDGCAILLFPRITFFRHLEHFEGPLYDYLKYSVLTNVPSLASLSMQEKALLIPKFTENVYNFGQNVCEQGCPDDSFHLVGRGKLVVLRDRKMRGILHEYSFFGDKALMGDEIRSTSTCVDTPNALIFSLKRQDFEDAVGPLVNIHTRALYVAFLENVSMLASLGKNELEALANELVEVTFDEGEVIIQEGDIGSSFYILARGTAVVRKKGQEEDLLIYTGGQFFGERALLEDEPRGASVIAKSSNVHVLKLDRDGFERHLGKLKDIIAESARIIEKRSVEKDMTVEEFDFDRYLGCGMYGRVKLVTHKKTGAKYAMKCISKANVVATRAQRQILREVSMARDIDNPFTLYIINSYVDDTWIYILNELVPGGELFYHLHFSPGNKFPEYKAQFYTANVLLGLEHIHNKGYVYRDLKTENLLLDARGFVKIVDFGFAKKLRPGEYTYTVCGTPEYIAPEVIGHKGHDHRADYWSTGILIYELLVGQTPFYDVDQTAMLGRIAMAAETTVDFPRRMSPKAKDLIARLLQPDVRVRLGGGSQGIQSIMNHTFFEDVDWVKLSRQQVKVPYVPELGPGGLKFNNAKAVEKRLSPEEPPPCECEILNDFFTRIGPPPTIETVQEVERKKVQNQPDNTTLIML